MVRMARQPAYLLHKPSGQARVRIAGKDVYLGQYDSRESHERYDDLIREWRISSGNIDRYSLTIATMVPDRKMTQVSDSIRDRLNKRMPCGN